MKKRGVNQRSKVLILGAGGTGYAAVYAILKLNIKKIYVWNRTIEKAEKLNTFYNKKLIVLK